MPILLCPKLFVFEGGRKSSTIITIYTCLYVYIYIYTKRRFSWARILSFFFDSVDLSQVGSLFVSLFSRLTAFIFVYISNLLA